MCKGSRVIPCVILGTDLSKEKPIIFIKLNAGHDINGNARRVFVVINGEGEIVEAIDEGCVGDAEVRKKYPSFMCASGPTFPTSVKEYKHLLKTYSKS